MSFPANKYLYKSFKHHLKNDDYLETLAFLTFTVTKTACGKDPISGETLYKSILKGKIHGGVLFYDINAVSKYMDKLHPEVGDIIAIDFPDDKNRERYEITDCYDKQLTPDGISPLLHKYVWKCKAKRYINSYEEVSDEPEADVRVQEKHDYDQAVKDEVTDKITLYPDGEDAAYGGYDANHDKPYDAQVIDNSKRQKYDIIEGDECLDIVRFGCGSRLVTDGYDLVFVDNAGQGYIVSKVDHTPHPHAACYESGLKWLKASDDCVTFTNVEG